LFSKRRPTRSLPTNSATSIIPKKLVLIISSSRSTRGFGKRFALGIHDAARDRLAAGKRDLGLEGLTVAQHYGDLVAQVAGTARA
jgi:hypothetical protein